MTIVESILASLQVLADTGEASPLRQFINIFLNLDQTLAHLIRDHGAWVYAILFAVIFCETGLVITPFLPGDSLLFTVGALTARDDINLNIWLAAGLLLTAAMLGDAVNYAIGKFIGPRVFTMEQPKGLKGKILNKKHLERAHAFFEKYGGKAVVLGRWVPIVRTFVPFVAGAGAMKYGTFTFYNVIGAVIWVGVCLGCGYAFGNISFVQKNFEIMVLGIIFVSLIPIGVEVLRARAEAKREARGGASHPAPEHPAAIVNPPAPVAPADNPNP